MKTMKTEILLVFVLILEVCVCFELTETFGKQTIEDGPYGGEFLIVFHFHLCHFILKGVGEHHGLTEGRFI